MNLGKSMGEEGATTPTSIDQSKSELTTDNGFDFDEAPTTKEDSKPLQNKTENVETSAESSPEKKQRRIVSLRKLKEKVVDTYKFVRNRISTEARLVQNKLDSAENKLTQTYDNIRLVTNFNSREKAKQKLQESRDNQEKRMIEGGFINSFKDRANKNRMKEDIKESIEEVNRIIVMAHRTGDRLNQTVDRYNAKNKSGIPLRPIMVGEDQQVRDEKLSDMIYVAQTLRGVDDLTATALLRDVESLQSLTQEYQRARKRRDEAYLPNLYLGNQNIVNQNQKAKQAESNIDSIRVDRSSNLSEAQQLAEQRKKLVARRTAEEETFQDTNVYMPDPDLGTEPINAVELNQRTPPNSITKPIEVISTPATESLPESTSAPESESSPNESTEFARDFLSAWNKLREFTDKGLTVQEVKILLANGVNLDEITAEEVIVIRSMLQANNKNQASAT